jgi:hypothetical protein
MDLLPFILTVLYIVVSLLSPDVFPEEVVNLHVPLILGVLAILACIPNLKRSCLGKLVDTRLFLGLIVASTIAVAHSETS